MINYPATPVPADSVVNDLQRLATDVKKSIVRMIHAAGSGHASSSLSCAEIVTALRFSLMTWTEGRRDVFVMSKGHAAPAWYAALLLAGDVPPETSTTLRTLDSPFQGHPDRTRLDAIDATTGALGQGLSMAVGRALASRLSGATRHAWCLIGDGETQEGEIWEAFQFSAAHCIDNITVFLDYNKHQADGPLDNVMPIGQIERKIASFGWHAQEINGHSIEQILAAATRAQARHGFPSLIVAHTSKGHLRDNITALEGSHGAKFTDRTALEALSVLDSTS